MVGLELGVEERPGWPEAEQRRRRRRLAALLVHLQGHQFNMAVDFWYFVEIEMLLCTSTVAYNGQVTF